MATLEDRLNAKLVPNGDCLEYTGGKDPYGYGMIWDGNTGKLRAHRVAYEFAYGEIPEGLLVRHACDNPSCCAPWHLSLGTHAENMQDMMARGRKNSPKGSTHANAKLNEEGVLEIKTKYAIGGTSYSKLAKEYAVSPGTIAHIITGKVWNHVILNNSI